MNNTSRITEPGTGSNHADFMNDHKTGIASEAKYGEHAVDENGTLRTPEQAERAQQQAAMAKAKAEQTVKAEVVTAKLEVEVKDAVITAKPVESMTLELSAAFGRQDFSVRFPTPQVNLTPMPESTEAPPAPPSPIDQTIQLMHDMAERYGDDKLGTYQAWDLVGAFENVAHYSNELSGADPARFEAAVDAVLDMIKAFPDSKLTAMVGAAFSSAVAQVIGKNPEMLEGISEGLAADLSDLAAAIDAAISGYGEGVDFQAILGAADNLENWVRGRDSAMSGHESTTFAGDVDFAKFGDAETATDLMKTVLGDKYQAPSWTQTPMEAPTQTPPTQGSEYPPGVQALIDKLMSNPRFAALIRIIEAAMQQKENAQHLLNSKSGDLDEKTMAIYTQANKAADQLITTASNIQKSNNDMMDTLTRNVG